MNNTTPRRSDVLKEMFPETKEVWRDLPIAGLEGDPQLDALREIWLEFAAVTDVIGIAFDAPGRAALFQEVAALISDGQKHAGFDPVLDMGELETGTGFSHAKLFVVRSLFSTSAEKDLARRLSAAAFIEAGYKMGRITAISEVLAENLRRHENIGDRLPKAKRARLAQGQPRRDAANVLLNNDPDLSLYRCAQIIAANEKAEKNLNSSESGIRKTIGRLFEKGLGGKWRARPRYQRESAATSA